MRARLVDKYFYCPKCVSRWLAKVPKEQNHAMCPGCGAVCGVWRVKV